VYEADVFDLDDIINVDVFTMFDVLEHIEDDFGFIHKLGKIAGGHLLLASVPACPFLYSNHDKLLHHYRRYNRTMIKSVFEKSGYTIIEINYYMTLLFPIVLLIRLKEKIAYLVGPDNRSMSLI